MSQLSVVALCGSLRKNSYNQALLNVVKDLNILNIQQYDLAEIALYNEDIYQTNMPENVRQLREAIRAADGVLLVTPEYNGSVSGVLKNALDWVSRPPHIPVAKKPTAIMGATMGNLGTSRAQGHLRQICQVMGMLTMYKPEVMVSAAQDKFDVSGQLTDKTTHDFVKTFTEAFAAWINACKNFQ